MKTLTNNIKKAVIELLILKLLSEQDMYGYQITQEFRKRSNNLFSLLEGSMYPILYRLTDNNCITSYEQKVGKRQTRVYYHLESEGAKRLAEMREEYETAIFVVNFLLDSKEEIVLKNMNKREIRKYCKTFKHKLPYVPKEKNDLQTPSIRPLKLFSLNTLSLHWKISIENLEPLKNYVRSTKII